MRHTIQPVDVDAVHQQHIALRPIIAIERERTLYRESRVDDTATSLAEKIVDTEIENVYSPLNSRTFPKAITKNSDKRPAAAFFAKAAAGLLSGFFVMTLRNVLLFRGAANTKKLLQRLIHAAGVFLLFPFQPEHLKLPVSVGLVLVEFLGLDVAFEGTVKLQGVPVLLNVGQHAGNGGFLALKLRFAVP